MKYLPLGFVLFALVFSAITWADAQANTQPADVSLVDTFRTYMNLPKGEVDPLPALKDIQKSGGKNGLDMLATDILRAKPLAIRDAVLKHTTLQKYSAIQAGEATWEYGSASDRISLQNQLRSQAKILAKADPKKAKLYAQAAILFKAMDNFPAGNYGLRGFLKDKELVSLAGMNAEDADNLSKTIEANSKREGVIDYRVAGAAIDRLFKHLGKEDFNKAISSMDAWYKRPPVDDADRLEFARDAQQLLNHAIAAKASDTEKIIADRIQHWVDGASGDFKRWLNEASKGSGSPERVYNLAVWKDGKWVDTDTDGDVPK